MVDLLDELLAINPYSLNRDEKQKILLKDLVALTNHHDNHCREYHQLLTTFDTQIDQIKRVEDIPMIPVRLFKKMDLVSVEQKDIQRVMTSSGTSGQSVSKIYLDSVNAKNQTKVLTHIIQSFIGKTRLPLLILDTPIVRKDRKMFSARGAGIIGFSMFGRKIQYALDEHMELDLEGINNFLSANQGQPILMFGYTYMIWEFIVMKLKEKNINLSIDQGMLFHIGGWKKLEKQKVTSTLYNESIRETMGNVEVHNYYGMAEQLGSVFVECEHGHMHCSNYSDVIIRRSSDFSVANHNEVGLIELVSVLPSSYPGHVILTEDLGEILGEDDCPCQRKGKYFRIHGRVKNAEIRGCSDTYER